MRVQTIPDPLGPRLVVAGDLDAYAALRLRRRLYDLAFGGDTHLGADLSQVRFVDATGIRILARAWRTAGRATDLRLEATSGSFDQMAARAGVSWVFVPHGPHGVLDAS